MRRKLMIIASIVIIVAIIIASVVLLNSNRVASHKPSEDAAMMEYEPLTDPTSHDIENAAEVDKASANVEHIVFNRVLPQEAVKAMSPGWNMGNTLDAIPREGSWGQFAYDFTFEDIKNSGFNSVRIPITWDVKIADGPDYVVDPNWMRRVEEVVDWALESDLYVMINMHHDSFLWVSSMAVDPGSGKYINNFENNMVKMEKVWQQIAVHFKDKSEKLMFEFINEPDDGPEKTGDERPKDPDNPEVLLDMTADQMNELNERLLRVVRQSGGHNAERLVVIGGLWNDSERTMKELVVPDDQNLIVTVHYYSPWDFLMNWWGKNTWGNAEEKQYVDDLFKQLYDTYVSKGIPVIIGEFSTSSRIDRHAQWIYYDYVVRKAYDYDMTMMWWDNGEHFNRIRSRWLDEATKDIIVHAGRGINNALINPADHYIHASSNIEDAQVALELNGNMLTSIIHDDYILSEGQDYSFDREEAVVTLHKAYIATLLTENILGVNASLTFEFSQGAKQSLNLIQYELPQFKDERIVVEQSNHTEKRVTVQFNGTKLRNIIAIDANNGRPIREDFTPYLRMFDHFDFSEGNNTITLTEDFMNAVTEDALLTFEFYPETVSMELRMEVK